MQVHHSLPTCGRPLRRLRCSSSAVVDAPPLPGLADTDGAAPLLGLAHTDAITPPSALSPHDVPSSPRELWSPRCVSPRFVALPQLNDPSVADALLGPPRATRVGGHTKPQRQRRLGGSESSFDALALLGDGAYARLGRALATARAVDAKEFVEALEVFHVVRKRVRRPCVVDLACGHGLVGLLFGVFEPSVARVVCVDWARPPSYDVVLAACCAEFPWLAGKASFVEADFLDPAARNALLSSLPGGGSTGFTAVHACGSLTDACLDAAVACSGPIAALPCCYTGTAATMPLAVRRLLGVSAAADVGRAQKLDAAGYVMEFGSIPRRISPMNRLLIATPRRPFFPPDAVGELAHT